MLLARTCYLFLFGVLIAGSELHATPPSARQVSTAPSASLPASNLSSSAGLASPGADPKPVDEDFDARLRRLESALRQSSRHSATATRPQTSATRQADDSGLFGSIEVTFLKPRISGVQPAFGSGTGRMLDAEHETALRYVLGYKGESGLGLRARYWSFDHVADFVAPYAPAHLGINVQSADTEIVSTQNSQGTRFEFAAGVRYGKLEYFNDGVTFFGAGGVTFEGVGPTIAIDIRREVADTGLTLFGNLRGAALVGDISNNSLLLNIPAGNISDEWMTVLENQLGVSWRTDVFRETTLILQAAWETQHWQNNTLSDDVYGIGSNLLLMGPTISATLEY